MLRYLKGILFLIVIGGLVGLTYDATTMPRYNGPVTERFDGKAFYSSSYEKKKPTDILKWSTNRNQGPWDVRATHVAQNVKARETNALRITLVNHSTVLIQVASLNLLTDPIWSESTGPWGRFGPSRYREPGIQFDQLPPIDVVFVSHSHYDHMDLPTLKRLYERDQPAFIVGLGNTGNLRKVGIDSKVVETDWWQTVSLNASLSLTMTPSEHWSKRSMLDTNRTLWGGFVLHNDTQALVFYAGDTGYGEHFAQIQKRFGPVQLALLPIGAYLPRWFMQDNHISPSEALGVAATLRSSVMIPVHYGTFALGDDGQDQPLTELQAAYQPGEFELRVLDNGQTTTLKLK